MVNFVSGRQRINIGMIMKVNFVFQQNFSPTFRGHWPKNWKEVGNPLL